MLRSNLVHRQRRPSRRDCRLRLESLERRETPSATYISDSDGHLFTVVPDTGQTTYIGRMRETMTDIAMDSDGQLWGVSERTSPHGPGLGRTNANLFRINTANAAITKVGKLSLPFSGLAFRGEELFGSTSANAGGGTDIYRISTANGHAQREYRVPFTSWGDIAFDGDGNLFLTVTNFFPWASGDVVKVNSTFTSHEVVANTGLTHLFGLAYSDGSLYAFNSPDSSSSGIETVHQIDPVSGATSLLSSITSSNVHGVFGAASRPEGGQGRGPGDSESGNGPLAPGNARIIHSLPALHFPEGVAVAADGSVFVGNRRFDGNGFVSEILRVQPGSASVVATIGAVSTTDEGLLGLAVGPFGDVFAAMIDYTPDGMDLHGVWQIAPDGSSMTLLPGTQNAGFPNAITFDDTGNLYFSDSYAGLIWRFDFVAGSVAEVWAETHPLLQPFEDNPYGLDLPGANGVAFYPHPTPRIYVANTERGLIARVPILPDGSAGVPQAVSESPLYGPLASVDGIAVDVRGHIVGVIPGSRITGHSPVVSVNPHSGVVTALVAAPSELDKFDLPLSLAFAAPGTDIRSVFVTNSDLFLDPEGPGPGVVQVGVPVPGYRNPPLGERDPWSGGVDRIVGNDADDILIAAWAVHENLQAELSAVFDKRAHTDRTYSQRNASLRFGKGLNGSIILDNTTIFADDDSDVLTGSAGNDWFIFDHVRDRVTDLNDEVFLNDLAFIGV